MFNGKNPTFPHTKIGAPDTSYETDANGQEFGSIISEERNKGRIVWRAGAKLVSEASCHFNLHSQQIEFGFTPEKLRWSANGQTAVTSVRCYSSLVSPIAFVNLFRDAVSK